MDDYVNFVKRMGSFEESLDGFLDDRENDELNQTPKEKRNLIFKVDRMIVQSGMDRRRADLIKSIYKDEYNTGVKYFDKQFDDDKYKEEGGGAQHYANLQYEAYKERAKLIDNYNAGIKEKLFD